MLRINYLRILTILLFAFTIFLCFFKLQNHEIQQWDELTNISVVKESLNSENPLILKYQGEPFFEKPPLWYWMTMGFVKIFGENIFNFRFISAISGVLLIWLVYKIGKDFWGEIAGLVAGFSILGTGHLFINNVSGYFSTHNFRSADLDALQILFIMTSFCTFYLGLIARNKNEGVKYFCFSFLMSGLAVLTKGFFGLLPVISGLIFLILQYIFSKERLNYLSTLENAAKFVLNNFFGRFSWIFNKFIPEVCAFVSEKFSRPKITWKTFLLPALFFLLIVIPWHLYMTVIFGRDFINEYFLYHLFQRATRPIESHSESISFYFQMLFNLKVFVSGVLLFFGIFTAILKKDFAKDFRRFCPVFCIFLSLIIFTLIPTKLAWYNLYVYPFSALMIGFLAHFISQTREKLLRFLGISVIAVYLILGLMRNFSWVLEI